jgi:hypothetical protein
MMSSRAAWATQQDPDSKKKSHFQKLDVFFSPNSSSHIPCKPFELEKKNKEFILISPISEIEEIMCRKYNEKWS